MKFGFVAKHRGTWPVDVLCESLGISRSGFYASQRRAPSVRARTDAAILRTIRASYVLSDSTYGARPHDRRGSRCEPRLRPPARRRARPIDTGIRAMLAPNVLDR